MNRILTSAVLTSIAGVLFSPIQATAQRANRMAIEAAVASLPEADGPLFVEARLWGPRQISRTMSGISNLDEPTRQRLIERFDARIMSAEEAITCADDDRPETCKVLEGGVVLRFIRPEPIRNGLLQLRLLRFIDGAGTGGRILLEAWNILLRQDPQTGWTALEARLDSSVDGPW